MKIIEEIKLLSTELVSLDNSLDNLMYAYAYVDVNFEMPGGDERFSHYKLVFGSEEDQEDYMAIKSVIIKHYERKIQNKKEKLKELVKML